MTTIDIDDDELVAQALAADPDAAVPDDAVPFWQAAGDLLPSWYMPAAVGTSRLRPWQRWTIAFVVAAFLLIDVAGMCSTYGWVVVA